MEESGDIRQFGATPLKFTSCQAQNADDLCEAITRFVGGRLGIRTEFVGEIAWQERARQFDLGEIQICWLCGWPYVTKVDGNLLDLDPVRPGPAERYATPANLSRFWITYCPSLLQPKWLLLGSHAGAKFR